MFLPVPAGKKYRHKRKNQCMTLNTKSWKKGQSGNPSGKPRGSRNSKIKEGNLEDLLLAVRPKFPAIVDEQIKLASQGDYHATRLLFEYSLPKQKAYIVEAEADDEWDLDGLDTKTKRDAAKEVLIEAQLKIQEICERSE